MPAEKMSRITPPTIRQPEEWNELAEGEQGDPEKHVPNNEKRQKSHCDEKMLPL
jgi:hypothetical protein